MMEYHDTIAHNAIDSHQRHKMSIAFIADRVEEHRNIIDTYRTITYAPAPLPAAISTSHRQLESFDASINTAGIRNPAPETSQKILPPTSHHATNLSRRTKFTPSNFSVGRRSSPKASSNALLTKMAPSDGVLKKKSHYTVSSCKRKIDKGFLYKDKLNGHPRYAHGITAIRNGSQLRDVANTAIELVRPPSSSPSDIEDAHGSSTVPAGYTWLTEHKRLGTSGDTQSMFNDSESELQGLKSDTLEIGKRLDRREEVDAKLELRLKSLEDGYERLINQVV
jgi:hypothetical protein